MGPEPFWKVKRRERGEEEESKPSVGVDFSLKAIFVIVPHTSIYRQTNMKVADLPIRFTV